MKKKNLIGMGLIGITMACSEKGDHIKPISLEYPETKKTDHYDEYWGEKIADPFRWLEDDHAEDTKAWVKEQNEVSFGYLEQIPFRKRIRERLEEVWDYEKFSADHDDRVVPAHSYKFAAHLQEAHEGLHPVIIRIETDAGHGAGKPIGKIIDEMADKFAFAWYNMQVDPFKQSQQ